MGKKSKLKKIQASFIKRRCEYQIEKIFLLSEILSVVNLCDQPNTTLDTAKIIGIVEVVQKQINDRCFRLKRILEESEKLKKWPK
jgi:hypothetical protein